MRALLLVNPAAGRRRAVQTGIRVAQRLREAGVHAELVESRTFEHGVELAEGAKTSDWDIVVAVGGDGTAHAVANGLCRSPKAARPAMGIVPCGRGNDFAAQLGIRDLETACGAVLGGVRRAVDIGCTEARFFLGVAGAGFDSQVARRAQRRVPVLSGTGVYVYSVLRTLAVFEPFQARIVYDSGEYEGPITFAAVGNTSRYGGGMCIAPHASMDDGLLDLCLVKEISRATLLRMFPRVFSGAHIHHPQVFYTQTKSVAIESSVPAELFADGEFLQRVPVRIDVAHRALTVATPPGRRGKR
ncbi:MAG: diacylglycerol/lipid kinase family protein [Acidobacteriota bacterium]